MKTIAAQYELVKESREVVFEYCERFSKADYSKGLDNFNKKSIRDLHVHVANSYLKWIPFFGQGKSISYFDPREVNVVQEMREVFKSVNAHVADFLDCFSENPEVVIENEPIDHQKLKLTPLQLMTHVITHEFHHKGQILSMGRLLGYIPPDADIIRT